MPRRLLAGHLGADHRPGGHRGGLRETSVVIAALLATFLLKEPFGAWRVAAAATVAAGAILLRF